MIELFDQQTDRFLYSKVVLQEHLLEILLQFTRKLQINSDLKNDSMNKCYNEIHPKKIFHL